MGSDLKKSYVKILLSANRLSGGALAMKSTSIRDLGCTNELHLGQWLLQNVLLTIMIDRVPQLLGSVVAMSALTITRKVNLLVMQALYHQNGQALSVLRSFTWATTSSQVCFGILHDKSVILSGGAL
jgi:hypothetical protein